MRLSESGALGRPSASAAGRVWTFPVPLAPVGVGDADDSALGDRRVGRDGVLDLGSAHVGSEPNTCHHLRRRRASWEFELSHCRCLRPATDCGRLTQRSLRPGGRMRTPRPTRPQFPRVSGKGGGLVKRADAGAAPRSQFAASRTGAVYQPLTFCAASTSLRKRRTNSMSWPSSR